MLEGIEILSQSEVVAEYSYNYWLAGFIFLGIIFIGGIIGFVAAGPYEKLFGVIEGMLIGVLLGLFVWIGIIAYSEEPISYETQYKVTISDEVSLNEFNEYYEIIKQEGKIYTIVEKE